MSILFRPILYVTHTRGSLLFCIVILRHCSLFILGSGLLIGYNYGVWCIRAWYIHLYDWWLLISLLGINKVYLILTLSYLVKLITRDRNSRTLYGCNKGNNMQKSLDVTASPYRSTREQNRPILW